MGRLEEKGEEVFDKKMELGGELDGEVTAAGGGGGGAAVRQNDKKKR